MRVTHEMIANQVVFNLRNSIERYFKIQNMMSTNRRINKPSDDPVGTMKDLSYREHLSAITQYKSNISIGKSWLESSDQALNDVNTALRDAYSTAVEMSNDTYDATARNAAANDIESLLDQILASGNSQLQNDYIFSGYRTRTQPFQRSATGVEYVGDNGQIDYTIDSRAKVQVNSVGSDIFTSPFQAIGENSDVNLGIVGTTQLSSLNNGNGVDLAPGNFVITDNNTGASTTIALSIASTVDDVINLINVQLAGAGMTNLTASLGIEGNNLKFEATASPTITTATKVENLNGGNGIDNVPGKFVIRNASGTIDVVVDVSDAVTVGDVINTINTSLTNAGVSNVTASLNGTNTGIAIADTNGVPLGLRVEETSPTEFTADSLGITGLIATTLQGEDLNPQPDFTVSEQGAGTTAADLGILGDFNFGMAGDALNPQMLGTSLLSQFQNNLGIPGGDFKISQGGQSVTLNTQSAGLVTVQDLLDAINNSGLDVTASINDAGTGIQIANNDPAKSLMITNGANSDAATKLGINDSADLVSTMMFVLDALRKNDRASVEASVGTLDKAINKLLDQRAATGAKVVRLDTTNSRLEKSELNYTNLLSGVEDADITKLVTDLAMQDNAYNAALQSAARIIQPSLLDFIK